jgi:hypothetical protein
MMSRNFQLNHMKFPFTIEMPCCGHKVVWESERDFPENDTACPCGKENFWIVKYEDLEEA